MLSHLYTAGFKNAVWLAHPSTIPQLASLSVTIGTAGSHIPVLRESDGKFYLLTKEVIFTEKLNYLGSAGDLLLADLSQYVVALKEELRVDLSQHAYFSTDQTAVRLISRFEGCPLWQNTLTTQDSSHTVSPFVILAERS